MRVINFMGQSKLALLISGLMLLVSIGSLATRQLNWGLDFTGGTLVEVHYSASANLNAIRHTLETGGYAGAIVAGFGSDRDVLIRLPKSYSDQQGTALLGIKAVIAESFERIHRSNLVGMGVIPFEFTGGDTRKSLGLKGDETVSIKGLATVQPRQKMIAEITGSDGVTREVPLICRIDTLDELEYYKNGGILHYVLRNLATAA